MGVRGGYVRSLDAGIWFSPDYADERVPLLEQVLRMEDLEFELELKSFGRPYLRRVVEAVRAASAMGRTEFTSWNVPMLIALKSAYPAARIGLFSRRRELWMTTELFERLLFGSAELAPADVVHVYAADVTPAVVGMLQGIGMKVCANDAATAEEMERAVDAEVDRLSANDVRLALEVIGARWG